MDTYISVEFDGETSRIPGYVGVLSLYVSDVSIA